MEGHVLTNIIAILVLAIGVLFLCTRFKIPAVVGLLLTGIIASPRNIGLVHATQEVRALADIGVILLLFTIGIEFSFSKFFQLRRSALLGGTLQVALTIGATYCIARQWNVPPSRSLFIGFLVALSSTAIVMKLLQDKGRVDTPDGKTALAILIFQDVIIVPMILVTPLLAGSDPAVSPAMWMAFLLKTGAIIVGCIVAARWLIPSLFYLVAGTHSRELFLLTVVALCLGVSWLTSLAGLSLALGAFLAGVIISESDYNQQALGNILPFRDVFSSFFFVSVGMLFDTALFLDNAGLILALVAGVIVLKALIAALAAALLGLPIRTTTMVGLALSQIGEFSFILANEGLQHHILSTDHYHIALAVSILTMVATPFVSALAPPIADTMVRLPLLNKLAARSHSPVEDGSERLQDHLIIVGFGINGKNLARAARAGGIPYVIIEMNPETVRREKAKGEPIYFGDATQEAVLTHAGISRARIITIVINDAAATRRITEVAKKLNPSIHIIARTRYVQEVQPLYQLGAHEVVPEEFETAVEIFTRLLKKYLVPQPDIEKLVAEVRADGYRMFRTPSVRGPSVSDVLFHITDAEVSTFRVAAESSCAGKTLGQMDLRKKHGITVVAIRRGTQMIFNPEADTVLEPGDTVVVMGRPEQLAEGICLFQQKEV